MVKKDQDIKPLSTPEEAKENHGLNRPLPRHEEAWIIMV